MRNLESRTPDANPASWGTQNLLARYLRATRPGDGLFSLILDGHRTLIGPRDNWSVQVDLVALSACEGNHRPPSPEPDDIMARVNLPVSADHQLKTTHLVINVVPIHNATATKAITKPARYLLRRGSGFKMK